MDNQKIVQLFDAFSKTYDHEKRFAIWAEHNKCFRRFWNEKVMNQSKAELTDSDIDEIVRILDRNGKGNTKDDEAVAKAMIAQGMWRRMFKEIKKNHELRNCLNDMFTATADEGRRKAIDKLYEINAGRKNSLTGKSGNAINAMLAAYDINKYSSVISLNDRRRLIEYFNFPSAINFDTDSPGTKMVESNRILLRGLENFQIKAPTRTIEIFLYRSELKDLWKPKEEQVEVREEDIEKPFPVPLGAESDPALFYMESQLEDFLIENWDKTELGKKYDLIEEDGEIVSQQYAVGIGKIDILVQDKKSKQLVVIELKKNQTSDDTVGQLTRYMGYLEEHKTNGKLTKGIIIASKYDQRLYYALKKVKDVEVYLYRVDFHLKEFEKD